MNDDQVKLLHEVHKDRPLPSLMKAQQAVLDERTGGGQLVNNRTTEARIKDQHAPIANHAVAIWDLVITDMHERDVVGYERYGTRLQPDNGRDALVDAYQELLDAAVYIRQAIYERDGK